MSDFHLYTRRVPSAGPPPAPGVYWRDTLAGTIARPGSSASFPELLGAVAAFEAGLVEVAGWLSDELQMGRVRVAELPGPIVSAAARYERDAAALAARARPRH